MGRSLTAGEERRTQDRAPSGGGRAHLAARLRTGSALHVLNTSQDGMLVESPVRLLPGRHIDVVLQCGSTREQTPWIVIHSRVGCIRGSSDLRYRVGLLRAMRRDYSRRETAHIDGHPLPATPQFAKPAGTVFIEDPTEPAPGIRFGKQETA
jgi:hypothetical protein